MFRSITINTEPCQRHVGDVTTQSQATLSIATAPDEPARSTTEVLLDAALGGDGHAFSQLVKPHLKLLYW
jgi:hypothetical protein